MGGEGREGGEREEEGVELAEIPESGHFPMYSNPVEMYRRIAAFLHRTSWDLGLKRKK